MNDSVKWLRTKYQRHGEIEDKIAADELEQKTRALEKIADYVGLYAHLDPGPKNSMADIARKALSHPTSDDVQKTFQTKDSICTQMGHDFIGRGEGTAKCRDCGELVDITETGAARSALTPQTESRK